MSQRSQDTPVFCVDKEYHSVERRQARRENIQPFVVWSTRERSLRAVPVTGRSRRRAGAGRIGSVRRSARLTSRPLASSPRIRLSLWISGGRKALARKTGIACLVPPPWRSSSWVDECLRTGIDTTSMPTSSIRLTAFVSYALLSSVTSASAQRASSIDASGLQTLVARSTSHAVYVERAVIQRPTPNALPNGEEGISDESTNPAVAHALGCLIVGSVGTGIAAMAGTKNVVNIIAGGHVVPASQLALYTAVVGVLFGTFCAVGQALTPLYLHVVRSSPPPAPPPPLPRRQLEQKVRWDVGGRTLPAWIERSAVGSTEPEEDMSVPASWLHRKP
jgi:hypothetical protein